MSIQTDLSIAPYHDDFDENKDFYKVLFRPGVSVQARELNQLQTILQKQVERFGDNIYRRGTIIDGCTIAYHPNLPYVKIRDLQTNGTPINVNDYEGMYVRNAANLNALIVTTDIGYESQSPDLNTLYVKYLNSGNTANLVSFSADQVLEIYNVDESVFDVKINDGSSGFSNTDFVVFMSAIAVQNTASGTDFASGFNVGDIITNGITANAEIVAINTTSNSDYHVLELKPLNADLQEPDSAQWTFNLDDSISNANTGQVAKITGVIGSGASATVETDAVGRIININVISSGSDYSFAPRVRVATLSANSSQIIQANLESQMYVARVAVANSTTTPIGQGYGLSVGNGVIYQKGYFSRVEEQFLVVSKYDNVPNEISVGFDTYEEIINSNIDTSLLDNATGESNETAPGADRLKLTPTLVALNKVEAEANANFFSITDFSEGRPYHQSRLTEFNSINTELARRTFEESGNYVIDEFNIGTVSTTLFTNEASRFTAQIDPGLAYINGRRVETVENFNLSIDKGTDSLLSSTTTITMDYGSFVKVREVAGQFEFHKGSLVDLYDTAKTYVSASPGTAITPAGTKIGEARMRSFILDSGVTGTSSAIYKLYLFDVKMNSGKNFRDVKSIHFDGTYKGICDTVTEYDATTGQYVTILKDNNNSTMAFYAGVDAIKNANNVTYDYRTNIITTANSTGYVTKTLDPDEHFPYGTILSSGDKRDLILVPLANTAATANIAGSAEVVSGNNQVVGTSTSFLSVLSAGDFISVANSTVSTEVQISSVANNTLLFLTENAGTSITGNVSLYFPQNIPIALDRSSREVTTSANGSVLTVSVGANIASVNVALSFNVRVDDEQSLIKTVNRNRYVRIDTSNNTSSNSGPWCLGVSDIFRMRGTYIGTNANTSIEFDGLAGVNADDDFIIITDNPFSINDVVTYTTPGTVISGLANANSYFVSFSNSTGVALAATEGGANIALTVGTANTVHTLEGVPYHFNENTYGVTDVTNHFFIDHNHTEDYGGEGYLLKRSNYTVPNNAIILVKFDAFTSSDGMKLMSKSYVPDDTLTLAQLDSAADTINTMEIPEFYSKRGEYYDLRDCIDFRPVVENTATLASSAHLANVNPVIQTSSARYTTNDKRFPVPGSEVRATIEYYVGRKDLVVVDEQARIRSLKGSIGSNTPPFAPENSLIISTLNIPKYPSLPRNLSADMFDIVNVRVSNEKFLTKRIDKYTVSGEINSATRKRLQPRRYTMEEIGKLERRIESLEYYVSFNFAESLARDRTIPSNTIPGVDRFKFGFFVDSFTNYDYTELDNPEYSATIINGRVIPSNSYRQTIELQFNDNDSTTASLITGKTLMLPYVEQSIVSQLGATDGAATESPVEGNTTFTQAIVNVQYTANHTPSPQGNNSDTYEFYMSSTAGPVELYIGFGIDLKDSIEVYYGSEKNFSIEGKTPFRNVSHAVAIDSTEMYKSTLVGSGFFRFFKYLFPLTSVTNRGSPLRPARAGAGKISWTHDPTNGRYVKVKVIKYDRRSLATFRLWYPFDVIANAQFITPNIKYSSFRYRGYLWSNDVIKPASYLESLFGSWSFFNKKLKFEVTGLKPNTQHILYVAGVATDLEIVSDKKGRARFKYYLGNQHRAMGIHNNKYVTGLGGPMVFQLLSVDDSSEAVMTADPQGYIV